MEGITQYKADAEGNTRDKHGLTVGDEVDTGWRTETVVEIDDDGVKFDDGSTADHATVAHNLNQIRENQN